MSSPPSLDFLLASQLAEFGEFEDFPVAEENPQPTRNSLPPRRSHSLSANPPPPPRFSESPPLPPADFDASLFAEDPEMAIALARSNGINIEQIFESTDAQPVDSLSVEYSPLATRRRRYPAMAQPPSMKIPAGENRRFRPSPRPVVSLEFLLERTGDIQRLIEEKVSGLYKPEEDEEGKERPEEAENPQTLQLPNLNQNTPATANSPSSPLVLHSYQLECYKWLVSLHSLGLSGALLADEMGLGKTVQTIAFVCFLAQQFQSSERKSSNGVALIVAPLSVVGVWLEALERWTTGLPVLRHSARPAEIPADCENPKLWRRERLDHFLAQTKTGGFRVLLTSFELFLLDFHHFSKISSPFSLLVLDEAHRIKNEESRLFLHLVSVRSSFHLALTGTPIQNNIPELFSLLQFIAPEFFPQPKQGEILWKKQLLQVLQKSSDHENSHVSQSILEHFHAILRPFLLRRLKKNVLNLPEKQEILLYCPMTRFQREIYEEMENYEKSTEKQRISSEASENSPYAIYSMNNLLLQYRKCANSPLLLASATEAPYSTREILLSSGKFLLVHRLLQRMRHFKHKILIFAQFLSCLDYLEEILSESPDFRDRFVRLDGNSRSDQRAEAIAAFATEEKQIFLLSTRAGALGLNLTEANTVILFESDWNSSMDLQASDRSWRLGQSSEVRVYRILLKNSIEEKIIRVGREKIRLQENVIEKGKFQIETGNSQRPGGERGSAEGSSSGALPIQEFELDDVENSEALLDSLIARTPEELRKLTDERQRILRTTTDSTPARSTRRSKGRARDSISSSSSVNIFDFPTAQLSDIASELRLADFGAQVKNSLKLKENQQETTLPRLRSEKERNSPGMPEVDEKRSPPRKRRRASKPSSASAAEEWESFDDFLPLGDSSDFLVCSTCLEIFPDFEELQIHLFTECKTEENQEEKDNRDKEKEIFDNQTAKQSNSPEIAEILD